MSDIDTNALLYITPREPKWYFTLGAADDIQFLATTPPNWFHRHMRRFLLGIYWRRI